MCLTNIVVFLISIPVGSIGSQSDFAISYSEVYFNSSRFNWKSKVLIIMFVLLNFNSSRFNWKCSLARQPLPYMTISIPVGSIGSYEDSTLFVLSFISIPVGSIGSIFSASPSHGISRFQFQ